MLTTEQMNELAKKVPNWSRLEVILDRSIEYDIKVDLQQLIENKYVDERKEKLKCLVRSMSFYYQEPTDTQGSLETVLQPGYFVALRNQRPDYVGPMLSDFVHFFGAKTPSLPEYCVFQLRGPTLVAPGQVQIGGAGFVDWNDAHPYTAAIRELDEEILKNAKISQSDCLFVERIEDRIRAVPKPETILDFLPFSLKDGTPNPLLGYAIWTDSKNLKNIPEASIDSVRTISREVIKKSEELKSLPQGAVKNLTEDAEVRKAIKVKFGDLENFLQEIDGNPGFYGPCLQSGLNFINSF